jgi:hypothetical protein
MRRVETLTTADDEQSSSIRTTQSIIYAVLNRVANNVFRCVRVGTAQYRVEP